MRGAAGRRQAGGIAGHRRRHPAAGGGFPAPRRAAPPHCPSPRARRRFGKRLAAEAARRWTAHYVDYKAIKKAIKDDIRKSGEARAARAARACAAARCSWRAHTAAMVLPAGAAARRRGSAAARRESRSSEAHGAAPPCSPFSHQTAPAAARSRYCWLSCGRSAASTWRRRTSWRHAWRRSRRRPPARVTRARSRRCAGSGARGSGRGGRGAGTAVPGSAGRRRGLPATRQAIDFKNSPNWALRAYF
jgi:hypothetical protein